jgi:hypothetical protein
LTNAGNTNTNSEHNFLRFDQVIVSSQEDKVEEIPAQPFMNIQKENKKVRPGKNPLVIINSGMIKRQLIKM